MIPTTLTTTREKERGAERRKFKSCECRRREARATTVSDCSRARLQFYHLPEEDDRGEDILLLLRTTTRKLEEKYSERTTKEEKKIT